MNASQMLAHIADQLRMALGDIPARNGSGVMSVWPVNYLMIHVVPWPHGAKGPREAFTTKPNAWDSDREALVTLIDTFCEKKEQAKWPEHPLFGKLRQGLGCAFVQTSSGASMPRAISTSI